jgi:hypothetical protein
LLIENQALEVFGVFNQQSLNHKSTIVLATAPPRLATQPFGYAPE